MPVCDQCGNDYDKAFQVLQGGQTHTFDSFECAIQKLAPTCSHCQVRIVGHGLEAGGRAECLGCGLLWACLSNIGRPGAKKCPLGPRQSMDVPHRAYL